MELKDAKYLSLPIFLNKSKKEMFTYITDRLLKRLNGWKEALFSPAGREILVKAVLMALPNYAMSCFRLPKTLTRQLSAAIAKFWWSSKE